MLELNDSVLLKEYVEHGSEEAFATLVARHVNKVYSIALRRTRNAHHAEEITQVISLVTGTLTDWADASRDRSCHRC
jgi:hypothetical protein